MLTKRFVLLMLFLSLSPVLALAQETTRLEPGKPIEREIAGGEEHAYALSLVAGQFVRVWAQQRGIDVAVSIAAPDGKEAGEANLTGAGGLESFSHQAIATGDYRIVVRTGDATAPKGAYHIRLEVKAAATAQDRQRIAAERLLAEAIGSSKRDALAVEQTTEEAQRALPLWRALADRYWEAFTLNLIGNSYLTSKRYDQAIAYYNQALAVRREIKDRVGEGNTLANLGATDSLRGQYEKALAYFEQALRISREIKDRHSEGARLNMIGNAYRSLGRTELAIASYEQSLTIVRDVMNRAGAGETLYNLGGACAELGRYEKAIEYYEQALAISREIRNREGERQTLNDLGIAHSSLSRYPKAIEYFDLALAISREVRNREGEGQTLNNLGLANRYLGRYEKAIEYQTEALAIFREFKDRAGEGRAFNNLGGAHLALGGVELAIEYFEQALAIFRECKYRADEGQMLNNLGSAHFSLGRTEKAIGYYEQALAIRQEFKNRVGEGETLGNLGSAYRSLGRVEKAFEYFERALAIGREFRNRDIEREALNHLGVAYDKLGRYEKAAEYFEQALAISREIKDRDGEGAMLINLGSTNINLGRTEKAVEYSEQALAISREVKNPVREGRALHTLAGVRSSKGDNEKAVEYLEQYLAISREVKSRGDEGIALEALGQAYSRLGRLEKAIPSLEQAVAIYRDVRERTREGNALLQLAMIETSRGNLAKARMLLEEGLRIAESIRADLLSPESRASFMGTSPVQESYRLYIDLLMRENRNTPRRGLDALAVEASERKRARSLLDLLTEANAELRQGMDTALLDRERILGRQLNDQAERLVQAKTREQAAALKQEISQLETDYERAQAAIRKSSPHYAALTQPQPLKLNEIQGQLDADTLLLEYALGKERSYLWAITNESLMSCELPAEGKIRQRAMHLYELLTARSTAKRGETPPQRRERIAEAEAKLPAAALELSQMILAPVAAQLGNKRLVVVPDGALQYIPFAILPEPQGEGSGASQSSDSKPRSSVPLIVGHEIVSLPSASALAIQRTELAGRQPAPKMLAVIADPVFDRTDARLTAPVTETSDNAQPGTIAFADARSIEHLAEKSDDKAGTTTSRLVIPRLPFTRQEADQLRALTPKTTSFRAIDFQANRSTVLDPALGQYRYVHFATHGFLDSERPGLSALVLSMVDAQGKPQDGFLRANDIYNMKLPAELVVLSACQTGLGKEIKGEGLVGLTRGFMYAGAARVVVSLWSVNDKATSELMTRFYEKMLKQGERPAAALRAAQVEMWKQKQWQSPYYWAAFTMQGEWR